MINNMGDSLSGQNKDRRIAGGGSNPSLPTKSVRTKLWKNLRKLDRKIGRLTRWIRLTCLEGAEYNSKTLLELDSKRKEIRLKLKGYK